MFHYLLFFIHPVWRSHLDHLLLFDMQFIFMMIYLSFQQNIVKLTGWDPNLWTKLIQCHIITLIRFTRWSTQPQSQGCTVASCKFLLSTPPQALRSLLVNLCAPTINTYQTLVFPFWARFPFSFPLCSSFVLLTCPNNLYASVFILDPIR